MFRDLPWKREKLTEIWNWPNKFWINLFGLWAEDASTPTRRRNYSILRTVVIVSSALTTISMLLGVLNKFSTDGLTQNLIAVFTVVPAGIASYKLTQIVQRKKSFQMAMKLLDELTEEIKDPEDVELMKKWMYRIWLVYILNMMDGLTVAVHWCLRPFLIAVLYHERTSILETWPAPLDTWTQFVITYIVQLANAPPLAFGFSMLDNIYLCICQYVLAHMDLLRKNIEDLHLNGQLIDTVNLTKIVKRHIKILRVCKELKSASDAALTVQIVATVLATCTGVFALTVNDQVNVNIMMNLIELMVVTQFRLYLFAWYSTEVTLTCKNLGTSAYSSDWTNGNELQKKELIMLVAKTIQPVVFGGLIRMDFDTFLMVFKSAFSYYNFLRAAFLNEN